MQEVEETWVCSLSWEDPLEKGKAIHSIILAGEPDGQQSIGSQRVGHDRSDSARQYCRNVPCVHLKRMCIQGLGMYCPEKIN